MSQGQFSPSTPSILPTFYNSQNSLSTNQVPSTSATPIPILPPTFYNAPNSVPTDKVPATASASISTVPPPYYNVFNGLPQVSLPAESSNSVILNSFSTDSVSPDIESVARPKKVPKKPINKKD